MKRIMALFVALLMLLSIVPMAFAEEIVTDVTETTETPVDTETTDTTTDTATDTTGTTVVETDTETAEAPVDTTTEDTTTTETAEQIVVEVPEDAQVTVTEVPAEETGVVTAEEAEEAGITPDQPVLWGIERAIERISLALTLGKSAKAQKGLAHARERLMEVKTMIAEKKLAAAEKAREQHGKALGHVKKAVEGIDGDKEPEKVLKEQTEFENELEDQERGLEQTREKARAKLKLTAEQQAKIAALINEFNGDVSDAKVKIELKKNKVRIAIQAKTGKSSEEVKEMGREIKQQVRAQVNKDSGENTESAETEEEEQVDIGGAVSIESNDDEEEEEEQVDIGGAVSIESDDDEED